MKWAEVPVKSIQVSTEVFAAIWAARKSGEETEDQILKRVLATKSHASVDRDFKQVEGFVDRRYDVVVPPGFRIFRRFKGKEFHAQAVQGFWVSSHDNKGYPSLNELSKSIGAGVENAWVNWNYVDERGVHRKMSELRKPSSVGRRSQPAVELSLKDLGLD